MIDQGCHREPIAERRAESGCPASEARADCSHVPGSAAVGLFPRWHNVCENNRLLSLLQKLVRIIYRKCLGVQKTPCPHIWLIRNVAKDQQHRSMDERDKYHKGTQDTEATPVPVDRWMDREDVVHTYDGILLSH